MRPLIVVLSVAALPALIPAAAASHPAPDRAEAEPVQASIVRHADGSFTITRPIPPFPAELDAPADAPFRVDQAERASLGPVGEPRSRSEEEADEALDEAFEEAVDMARQEAGPN